MKKIVATLLSLVTGSTFLLFPRTAKADRVIYCHPVTDNRVLQDSVARQHAYADGFRQGEQSARNREAYKPQAAGGEFARGFEDGYFNRPYAGQEDVVPSRVVQSTTQDCNEDGYYTVAPPPTVIYDPYVVAYPPAVIYSAPYYSAPYNYPIIDFNFGFGRRYFGRGYHRWGRYGRW